MKRFLIKALPVGSTVVVGCGINATVGKCGPGGGRGPGRTLGAAYVLVCMILRVRLHALTSDHLQEPDAIQNDQCDGVKLVV